MTGRMRYDGGRMLGMTKYANTVSTKKSKCGDLLLAGDFLLTLSMTFDGALRIKNGTFYGPEFMV